MLYVGPGECIDVHIRRMGLKGLRLSLSQNEEQH